MASKLPPHPPNPRPMDRMIRSGPDQPVRERLVPGRPITEGFSSTPTASDAVSLTPGNLVSSEGNTGGEKRIEHAGDSPRVSTATREGGKS
jgi:hypothetical protein